MESEISYQNTMYLGCNLIFISRPSSIQAVYLAIEKVNNKFPNIRYAIKFYTWFFVLFFC